MATRLIFSVSEARPVRSGRPRCQTSQRLRGSAHQLVAQKLCKYGWLAFSEARRGSLSVGAAESRAETSSSGVPSDTIIAVKIPPLTMLGAAEAGDENRVRELLQKNPGLIQDTDKYQETPLHKAVARGHLSTAKLLLVSGADSNIRNSYGWSALHIACMNGDLDMTRLLLTWAADVGSTDEEGDTSLHVAVYNDHVGVASLLLNWHADVQAKRQLEITPLHLAAMRGAEEMFRLLLDRGADAKAADKRGDMPLHAAARHGSTAVVALLLDLGESANTTTATGIPVLHLAAESGSVASVKLLLSRGAEVTFTDREGSSALHLATTQGHLQVVELLVAAGADCRLRNRNGFTPLHGAAMSGGAALTALLLKKGADARAANEKGWTALHLAADTGDVEVAKLLLDAGAGVSAQNGMGLTGLHIASLMGRTAMAKLLLSRGADPLVPDNNGKTPGDFAMDDEIAALIRSYTRDARPTWNSAFGPTPSVIPANLRSAAPTSLAEAEAEAYRQLVARLCSNRAPAAGQGAGISEQQRETLQEILVRFGLVPNTGLGFGPKGGRLPGLSGPPSFGGTAGQPGGAEGFNAAQSQAPRFQQPRAPGATIPGLPPLPPGSYGFDSQLGPSQQQESPLSTAADELIARLTSGSNASASKAVAAAARNAEARRLSAISRPRARSAPTPSPVSLPPPRPAQLQPPAFNGAPLGIGTPGFDPSAAAFGLGGMPGAGSNGPGAAGTGIGALPVVPTANQGGFGANGAPGGGAERVAPPEQPPPQQPLPQTTAPTWQDIANALAFPTPPERAWERAASGSSASASSSTSGSAAGAATASAAAATATTKRVFQRPGPPASSAPAPPPGPIEPTISSLAQAVFDSLGPAHPERVYQAALEVEFHLKAIGFKSFFSTSDVGAGASERIADLFVRTPEECLLDLTVSADGIREEDAQALAATLAASSPPIVKGAVVNFNKGTGLVEIRWLRNGAPQTTAAS